MQREFEIFTKSPTAPVAVKRGFSWPGFFFIWIWALSRGLWLEGVFILLADAAIVFSKFTILINHPFLCGLFSLALQFVVGIKGNYWRSRKLERAGYSFDGLIAARSATAALAAYARGEKGVAAVSFGFSFPRPFQRILAIAWLTWKAALRFKLFLVIAALLVLAVVALPLVIRDDGTAQGFTQIIITYTLSVTTGLLGLSTLWLACGTLARDIEECQIQVIATKPIARWQVWIGKWLGIITLNAALLAIAGAAIYGLLQWRASKLPSDQQAKLRGEVLVARGSAREQDYSARINADTARFLQDQAKQNPQLKNLSEAEMEAVTRQVYEQVKAAYQVVRPGYPRIWKIDLHSLKDFLRDKPLQLRVKFNTPNPYNKVDYDTLWQVGDPQGAYWRTNLTSMAPDTFHEFLVPPNLLDKDGILTIGFVNPNSTTLLFPLEDGMEVLYPETSFTANFFRGLAVIFCWMALLAALGLAAASYLSFPVAAFFSLAMLAVVLSSGTLAETVENGTLGVGEDSAGSSPADPVLIPMFKGILKVVNLTHTVSPIDALSTGRVISWIQLATTFGQIVLLLGGFFALVGIGLFYRRELATAQGTQ